MKTFKEFMQESSLSRIQSKSKKGIAVMSASRGDKSAKENRARNKKGNYIPDDPTTDKNEAWVGGKAPKVIPTTKLKRARRKKS